MTESHPGSLVLVATPIGNLSDLSERAIEVLAAADVVCCEDTRHTGVLLKRAGIEPKRLLSVHAHNEGQRIEQLLLRLRNGETIALVSDAGTPLVSDPGERLVAAAISNDITVTLVPGPSASLAAVVLSGLSTERWHYEGFLPRKGEARISRQKEIAASPCPSVIYEAPQRLRATLSELAVHCGPDRKIAICRELTKLHEEVIRITLGECGDDVRLQAPRGEFVIVVDGAGDQEPIGQQQLTYAIARLMHAGFDRHDSVKAVELLFPVSHREVYAAGLDAKAAQIDVI